MKKQSKKNLSIEKALRASVLPVLEENDLKSAQKRVWNELSSEIQKDQKAIEAPRPTFRFHFIRATKYALSFVFIFVLLSGSVLGGYYFYLLNNIAPVETAQNQVDKLNNEDLQSIAAARFAELNGVSFEQFKEAIKVEVPSQIITSPQTPKPTNIIKLDEKKAEEIIKTIENKDLNVFYTERTLEVKDQDAFAKASYIKDLPNNIDYSKATTILNWSRLNYSKNIILQENNIKKFEVQAPNENTIYFGGDYALQTKFTEQTIQIAGITNDGIQVVNPENEILKRILEDKNAKVKEIIKEDNKEIFVLELPLVSENENSLNKVVYYLDSKNLSIVREEYYIDSKLVYTIKTLNQKEEKVQNIEELINNSELQKTNTIIKTLDLSFNPKIYSVNKISFADYSSKYPVFSFEKDTNEDISKYTFQDFTDSDTKKYFEYLELVNGDQLIKSNLSEELNLLDKNIFATQTISKNFRLNNINSLGSENINSTEKKLTINGKEIAGILLKTDNSRILEFSFDNKNYSLNETTLDAEDIFILDNDISLKVLTAKEVEGVENYIKEKDASLPKLQASDISKLSESERLSINEYSKSNKLLITNIESKSDEYIGKCEEFYLSEYNNDYLNCLLILNNTFKITFSTEDNLSTYEVYYFPNKIDQKYMEVIKDNTLVVTEGSDYILVELKK